MRLPARTHHAARLALLVIVAALAVSSHRLAWGATEDASSQPSLLAAEIVEQSHLQGGLIVHVGCGHGRLTAALCAGEGFVVHGLDSDPAAIKAARRHIQSLGLYGRVAVESWAGAGLPYADNLVNLVISENLSALPTNELMRVLAPNGVALVRTRSQWVKIVKPRPPQIDEWTHFLHGADNNAVARDSQVGVPRSLRWVAPPLWLRSHETPSGFEAMVTGGGRVFYFLDEGLIGITDQRMPERWSLVCRDAFNGRLLWKRSVQPWGWPEWATQKFADKDWTTIVGGRTAVPDENQRRLVVDGDRLYATLGYREPMSILDAASGRTLSTVAETAPTRQIIAAGGIVLAYSQVGDATVANRKGKAKGSDRPSGKLTAVNGTDGAVLWRKDIAPIRGLFLLIEQGRIVCQAGGELVSLELQTGRELWRTTPEQANGKTLVASDGVLVMLAPKGLEAREAATGKLLWHKQVPLSTGLGSEDLFVIDGVVWPGVLSVDEAQKPSGKSPHALAIGYDLRTGEEQKRIFVENLRSPEHHHRCYRNKATECYVITAMEGSEFLDLRGSAHSQNNFVRGACKLGIMPANGLLYVPPDQCFCDPGAKLLGFAALASGPDKSAEPVPNARRLERGPAYGQISNLKFEISDSADWPTFRHDAARHASTAAGVATALGERWRVKLGGNLTAPVAVGDRAYVASRDAHTVHALDLRTGQRIWSYCAGGRIDSPPTIHRGLVLFGSADGRVYCLRADTGVLAWRFLAAPNDHRILCFDQLESVWPVHGSVLVQDDVAYVSAGRSTYLDGGIRLYGLDPMTGHVLHQTTLSGPFPDGKTMREVSFYIEGANSDVLVSEGGSIFMRQKRLTPSLQEQPAEILSTKGEFEVGRHVFSTAGLLDDSWYNRAFWMYSKRWPGFQLANQAPKSGQLLVVDGETTYAVQPFYRRNVHSPMFFPGKEGYLLFADKNGNEPQIVGEEGARKPVAWLPQSDYMASKGLRTLDSPAFGLDKMIGYTRAEPPLWTAWLPVRIRAMVKAADTLFVAGPPDEFDEKDPYASFEGRKGAHLVAVSAGDGRKLSEWPMDVPPVFDGMIAARGRLLVSLQDGSLLCLAEQSHADAK